MSVPQHSPAAERNRAPILERLRALLAPSGEALEIASGTGQHAACFAAALPGWHWQPSDRQEDAFDSIRAWAAQTGAGKVRAPVQLDVRAPRWPATGPAFKQPFDLIYCANMLHIAPWACCAGLMQGAARHLAPNGRLVTYGPYLEDDVPTARADTDSAVISQQVILCAAAPLDPLAQRLPIAGRAHFFRMTTSLLSSQVPFFTAQVVPEGASCDAWLEQSLLLSMEQGGIDWPSSCRNGTCRTCIGHLIAGEVRYAIEWPGLSTEELQAGCVLPCVAYPMSDVELERGEPQ